MFTLRCCIVPNLRLLQTGKYIHTTPLYALKKIEEAKDGKKLIFEAKLYSDPRDERMLKIASDRECCSICSLDMEIKHTDVLILSQFVRSDGCMLPRRITGLCGLQQKRVSKMVAMAQKAGLMSCLNPANSKQDPSKRPKWKKFNTYFDESTIRDPRHKKSLDFSHELRPIQ